MNFARHFRDSRHFTGSGRRLQLDELTAHPLTVHFPYTAVLTTVHWYRRVQAL